MRHEKAEEPPPKPRTAPARAHCTPDTWVHGGRSKLTGFLSRRNTASHRSSVVIIRCNIEITKLRALPLLFAASFSPRGIFTSFFVHSPTFIFDKIKNGAFHSKCEAPFNKSFSGDFLRRHYPHQVKKGRS